MDYRNRPEWMPPIEEMMPPENGIFEATTIEEAMPPEYASSTPKEVMPPEWPEWMPPRSIEEMMPPTFPSSRMSRILEAVQHVPRNLDYDALEKDIEASIGHYKALVEADEFLKRCKTPINLRREAVNKAREFLALIRKIDDDGWGKDRSDDSDDQVIDQIKDCVIKKYENEVEDLEQVRDNGVGFDEELPPGRRYSEELKRWWTLCDQCERWTH
jgi:hypothetical protein